MARTKEQILQEAMSGQVSPQTAVPAASPISPQSAVPTVGGRNRRQEILSEAQAQMSPGERYQQAIQRDPIARTLYSIPGTRPLMEFANAAGRSAADVVDFFGPDFINSILQVSGVEARMPTLRGSLESVGALAPSGAYMQPGLPQEIVSGAGSAIPAAMGGQALIREGVRQIPRLPGFQSTGRRVSETMARTTPAQEATAATGAVIGGEVGEETGIPGAGFFGSLAGGMGAIPVIRGIERMMTDTTDFQAMAGNLSKLRTDIAGEILAKSLRASGMSVDDAMAQYRALGPNALPADIDDSFRQILRAAMNADEGISGQARRQVSGRQQGAGQRISQSLDIISTDNIDDYMNQLDTTLGPQVRALYDAAAAQPLRLSGRLRTLMEGTSSLGRATREAQTRLADRRAAGDKVSHFDLVDETKRVLDDNIGTALNSGRRNEARNLIRLKNELVAEADAQIPGYRDARNLYAGKAAIEDAAKLGSTIFKIDARELRSLAESMNPQERNAYILSAKDAIIKQIDSTGMNRNQVQALFGKNGDAMKLATLFDDRQTMRQFMNELKRETDFALTRNAVIGNSSTTEQLNRVRESLAPRGGYKQAIGQAASLLTSNPASIGREVAGIMDNINAEKGSDLYLKGLIQAGEILLTAGMNPRELDNILRSGSVDRLTTELRRIAEPNYSRRAAAAAGMAAQQVTTQGE
jgi:hypothetical protein